ncbi:putative Uncharacterized pyrophosphatase/phosphodiesterase [Glarea lozoyensis 74030]|uniref:Putative Uncharacterized pyrophosphatase/phosphodiesterase n=1 Tax=Glarea lozoyensis (strain ATCC 74030 / MF5533) TaxID=1104152 RepID=H0EDA3_GLAL7|nr:putative Uncharacterized pyrophosphatase/phosphodiesterase [Glarea lozoyensis 74030]
MDVEPAFLDKFNPKEPLSNKVDRILELLDKPGEESEMAEVIDMRPQLIAATEIRTTIAEVDSMLDSLFKALEARNLTKIANVVVVSDHGMATVSNFIQLEDIIDTSLIEHTDGWPLYGLRPKDSAHLQGIYDSLKAASSGNDNYEVYLRDKDMPERYHFSKNERIAPLWIIPKAGWAIVTKGEFNVVEAKEKNLVYHPRGLHGYDHEHPLMRAIFVARGPAFPHAPNSRVESFRIDPKPNNGTLRLPLNTIGLHSPETTPAEPIDPQVPEPESVASPVQIFTQSAPPATSASEISSADPVIEISPIEASSAADPNVVPPTMVGVDTPEDANVDRPVVGDDSVVSEEEKNFWSWFTDEINKAKGWFSDIVGHGEVNENDEKKF